MRAMSGLKSVESKEPLESNYMILLSKVKMRLTDRHRSLIVSILYRLVLDRTMMSLIEDQERSNPPDMSFAGQPLIISDMTP